MKCPSCSSELKAFKDTGLELDACSDGCGGVWFDRDELLKFDEESEFNTSPILKLAREKEPVKIDPHRAKRCPHCPDETLVRQFLDIKNEVEMDQCWKCGGVWLDVGEINTLRGQYETIEDRQAAVNAYIDQKLAETKAALDENTQTQLQNYNEEFSSPLKSFLWGFKKLLGADDPYDGL